MKNCKMRIAMGWRERAVKAQMSVITLLFLLGISVIIWSATELKSVLQESTRMYVQDVAYQQASSIASRFEADKQMLEQVAEQMESQAAWMEESRLEDYLEEKEQEVDFDHLLVWTREQLLSPDFREKETVRDGGLRTFQGDITVSYGEGQRVYFAVPIHDGQEIVRVLVGMRENSSMQAMIQPKSFGGSGLSCIINPRGEMILSPTDMKPFLQLDHIFGESGGSLNEQAVSQMSLDIENDEAGVFGFTAVDGKDLILSYQPVGVNEWILLTLVPAELIAGTADTYIFRTFLMIGVIVAACAWLLTVVTVIYRRSRRELEKSAYFDPITGGMNNAAFQQGCRQLFQQSPHTPQAVVLLNVREFKLVNEFFGISVGNEVLRFIYQVLEKHIRSQELAARGEADNFFLCLAEKESERISERIEEMIQEIGCFDGFPDRHYALAFRQGVCLADDPGVDVTIIQERARIACQRQTHPGQCSFYNQEMTEALKRERELTGRFDQALRQGEFQVYLQPKVCLRNGCLGGAEALVRWADPRGGMISPGDFIPVFERSGYICRLDLYIFEQVCRLMNRWMEEGKQLFPVSVNLSRMHFRNPDFVQSFSKLKNQYGIPDEMLELEVTESIFFDDAQIRLVKQSIGQIHACGLKCSLDDFGMGFSSLGLLKEFDVDAVKLDRRFFDDMESEKSWKVIESFMELPGKLGISAVAEGIETEDQLKLLRRTQCDMVQGFVFSKPLRVEEFERWWAAHC